MVKFQDGQYTFHVLSEELKEAAIGSGELP